MTTETETPPTPTKPSLSGGELSQPEREAHARMRGLIGNEPDVHRVIALWSQSDGTWLYFIQTPFATYPKFVIGRTDEHNENPDPIYCFGLECTAADTWGTLTGEATEP